MWLSQMEFQFMIIYNALDIDCKHTASRLHVTEFVCNLSQLMTSYTVTQTKTNTQSFCDNIEPFSIILSLLHSTMNCRKCCYVSRHLTSTILLHYLTRRTRCLCVFCFWALFGLMDSTSMLKQTTQKLKDQWGAVYSYINILSHKSIVFIILLLSWLC